MRGEPYVTVTCDKCEDEIEMQLTALAGGAWDDRGVRSRLERYGWKTEGDRDYCEDCAKQS